MARARVLCSVLLLGLGGGILGWPSFAVALEEADRLWTVGSHAVDDGLYPLARRTLERFVERYPNDPRVLDATLLIGKARFGQKAYQAALDAFRDAARGSPPPGKPGEARFWEAETLFRMNRFAEARDAYLEVVELIPPSPLAADALYGRGWSSLQLKNREAAITDFRRVLAIDPEPAVAPSATFYLARALVDIKKPDEAIALLRAFPTKYKDNRLVPDARYLLGRALVSSGDVKQGGAELRAFAAAYPNHELAAQARRLAIDSALAKGDKGELGEDYKRLATQPSPTAESLYDAGVIAMRIGKTKEAETAWLRLRKDYPDHALAARASLDLGQNAFARNAFKDSAALGKAAAKSSDPAVHSEGLLLSGESELRLKHYPAALTAFQGALDTEGIEPAVKYRALAGSGLAMEEQQKWAQAAKYYDEVAAKSPDKTLRAWARERRAAIAPKLKDGKPATKSAVPKSQATPAAVRR